MYSNNGNTGGQNRMGYVRVMHAVPGAPNVDIYANDELIANNLAYSDVTDYVSLPEGNYKISLYAAGSKNSPIVSNMLKVNRNAALTVAAIGMPNNIGLIAISDADIPMKQNQAMIRFLHLSPNAPAVDITLPDGTILFRNVAYKHITSYMNVVPTNYTLQVRASGTDTIVLTVPDVELSEHQYVTVYAIGLVGSSPELEALLLADGY